MHIKKRFNMGLTTLIFGILSFIFPIFYSIAIVQIFHMLIRRNTLEERNIKLDDFVIYTGYAFFASYFVIIILGGTLGIIDLSKKPRPWHKENTNTIIGLALIFLSLIVIGRIFIFSELFHALIGRILH